MSEYWKKLKDPRWQKKRLEVMEAAGFTCKTCGSKTETLTVHHVNYRKGAEPWEYRNEQLACLCEPCHALIEQDVIPELRRLAVMMTPGACFEMVQNLQSACFHGENGLNRNAEPVLKEALTLVRIEAAKRILRGVHGLPDSADLDTACSEVASLFE